MPETPEITDEQRESHPPPGLFSISIQGIKNLFCKKTDESAGEKSLETQLKKLSEETNPLPKE